MKPFRERNRRAIAVVSLVVIVAAVILAVSFPKLPFLNDQDHFHADLADAGALVTGEQVTVAGVRVGTITGIGLAGNHVRLDFDVRPGVRLGSLTSLTVKVLSPLGQEYVQLSPSGPGRLAPGSTIPESRTTGTATILSTLNQAGQTLTAINQKQLAESLAVLSQDLSGTSPAATALAIKGLGHLSEIINDRQTQLSELVDEAEKVTSTLDQHRSQLIDFISQANVVLQVVEQRQSDIKELLDATNSLATRVSQIITDKQADLGALLAHLRTVSSVLAHDAGSLDQAIPVLSGLSTYLANATGSGEFFDAIAPTLLVNDHQITQCSTPGSIQPPNLTNGGGCRA